MERKLMKFRSISFLFLCIVIRVCIYFIWECSCVSLSLSILLNVDHSLCSCPVAIHWLLYLFISFHFFSFLLFFRSVHFILARIFRSMDESCRKFMCAESTYMTLSLFGDEIIFNSMILWEINSNRTARYKI